MSVDYFGLFFQDATFVRMIFSHTLPDELMGVACDDKNYGRADHHGSRYGNPFAGDKIKAADKPDSGRNEEESEIMGQEISDSVDVAQPDDTQFQ